LRTEKKMAWAAVRKLLRTGGYMCVLFMVDVLANIVADAMDLMNKHGGGEFKAHTDADKPAPAGISTVVFAVCAFVFAALACVGVWFRRRVTRVFARLRAPTGARRDVESSGSGSSEDDFSYISLGSDTVPDE
jgi:hypothetical protein